MDLSQLEVDEQTGLHRWPRHLESNTCYQPWTDSPCAVLFGARTNGYWQNDKALQGTITELLRSPCWPRLHPFRAGRDNFLVLAPHYSPEQALLLAQWVNRELSSRHFSDFYGLALSDAILTWGIAVSEAPGWSMFQTLQRAATPVWRATREGRIGSINEASTEQYNTFWVSAQMCGLTELPFWHQTIGLRPDYADERTALLLGDVDRMKNLLDYHGMPAGDRLLQLTAQILRSIESKSVTAFRSGGDKFAVWIRGQAQEEAVHLAEQINAQVRELQFSMDYSPALLSDFSLTWGVVSAEPHQMNIEAMFSKAEELVRDAKNQQRGTVKAAHL